MESTKHPNRHDIAHEHEADNRQECVEMTSVIALAKRHARRLVVIAMVDGRFTKVLSEYRMETSFWRRFASISYSTMACRWATLPAKAAP